MRKTTVVFSDTQWNQLCDIARREHRFPKQQIELWVYQALSREQAGTPKLTALGKASVSHASEGGASS